MNNNKIPVTILTGFLGSGKTTLLNRILSENHGKKIAVIENEFGEIGVDNELVIGADEEIFEMNNGCICCTVRGDLIRILNQLTKRKNQLDMIIVETTGMANPAPVAQTFWVDSDMQDLFSLDAIITVVDSKHIWQHLDSSDECKEQIAFADIILLNKTDLVSPEVLTLLQEHLQKMNTLSQIFPTQNCNIDLSKILDIQSFNLDKKIELNPAFQVEELPFEAVSTYQLSQGTYELILKEGTDPAIDIWIQALKDEPKTQKSKAIIGFSQTPINQQANQILNLNSLNRLLLVQEEQSFQLQVEAGNYEFYTQHHPEEFEMELVLEGKTIAPNSVIAFEHSHTHDQEVSSVGMEFLEELDYDKFNLWIGMILRTLGTDIFRSKGILNIQNEPDKVVFQGVHMLFDIVAQRPWHKEEVRKNQLVFIGKNLNREMLVEGFKNCLVS